MLILLFAIKFNEETGIIKLHEMFVVHFLQTKINEDGP